MNKPDAIGADIRLLGGMLGQVIRQVAGQQAFDLEEEVRAACKALRSSHSAEEARRLRGQLDPLPLPELRTLIRAFTVFFDLVNLAEQRARVRVLRQRTEQAHPGPIGESVEEALRQRGVTADDQTEAIAEPLRSKYDHHITATDATGLLDEVPPHRLVGQSLPDAGFRRSGTASQTDALADGREDVLLRRPDQPGRGRRRGSR